MNLFDGVPVLRRTLGVYALVPGTAVLVLSAVGYARTSEPVRLAAWCITIVVVGGWVWLWWRRLRGRARETLVRTLGRCCTHCAYPMVALDEPGNCPECGRSYYEDLAVRSWTRAAAFPEIE